MSISLIIIIATILVSIAAFQNKGLFDQLKFHPWTIKRERNYHRFLSYGFIHADFAHLAINMYVFYIFGESVEILFKFDYGRNSIPLFIVLYFGGLIISTIYSYIKHKDNVLYSAVGASGAVSAVVFAYIIMIPRSSLRLFLIPIDIPAWIFGGLYLVYSFVMARRGKGNIGHDAHFFGALYGVFFMGLLDINLILNLRHLI